MIGDLMNEKVQLRQATSADYDTLGEVMYEAVRKGRSHYSETQREAWVPEPRTGKDWFERLDKQAIVVAESSDQIVGFMSLAADAYLDFAYIRPSAQGSGLFRRMYAEIEQLAVKSSQDRIWVHASLMAQPAFASVGFSVLKRETVMIGKESFERYEMEKPLTR